MRFSIFRQLSILAVLGTAVSAASSQTLYTFPDQGYGGVYSFVNAATKTLDMTMYELTDTTFEQDLVALAKKGVQVRVILDHSPAGASKNAAARTFLMAHGVAVQWSSTAYTVTHQKTITVDGRISLILTANLTPQYYATSRDFAITDADAKDVAEIERVFNADFHSTAVTPAKADTLVWSPNLASATLQGVIRAAQHTLLVENEEMSDPAIVAALSSRAKAGVAVSVIMTNYNNEYASEFNALTKAGVKVYTYPYGSTGLYIHAKILCADASLSDANLYIGSINFSTTSETMNRELGQTTQSSSIIGSVSATLQADIRGATSWTVTHAAHDGGRTGRTNRHPARP